MPVENNAVENSNPNTEAEGSEFREDAFSQALAQSQQAAEAGGKATEAAPAQQAQAGQQPAQPDFLALAKEHGFTTDQFKTPADFLKAMAAERKQQGQFVQLGQQVAPHYQQFTSWMQEQQARAAQSSQQTQDRFSQQPQQDDPKAWLKEHFAQQWKVPAWDQSWTAALKNGLLVQDEDGYYAAAPGKELQVASIIGPLNAHREAQAQAMQDLFRYGNPMERMFEAMQPAFERQALELIQRELGQHTQQVTQQTAFEQWESANAAALYTQDTAGNQILTPAGEALIEKAEYLLTKGFTDQVEALQLAAKLTGFPEPAAQQAQAAKTPAQVNEEKKASFIDNARKRAAHAPSSGAYTPTNTPDAPFSVDESELENLFTNALAGAGQ